MRRWIRSASKVTAALLLAAAPALAGCYADVGYGTYDDYPPAEYVATAQPYYYEGRPAYWYNNHWYYRDGGRWQHYHAEPEALRTSRIRVSAPSSPRRLYERPRGHR